MSNPESIGRAALEASTGMKSMVSYRLYINSADWRAFTKAGYMYDVKPLIRVHLYESNKNA